MPTTKLSGLGLFLNLIIISKGLLIISIFIYKGLVIYKYFSI